MKFEWNRPLGIKGDPYARRWQIPLPGRWSIRLHNWLSDDDPEAMHDHPTWFWTFILRGGYADATLSYEEVVKDEFSLETATGLEPVLTWELMRPGMLRFRPAEHRHQVLKVLPNTWTLCLFGNPNRRWSFYKGGKMIKRDKYFAENGHHARGGKRVRLRPDGSVIPVQKQESES